MKLLLLLALTCAAQQAPAPPIAFDSATVKVDHSAAGARGEWDQPGRLTLTAVGLRMMIARAYDFASLSDAKNLIDGLPSWADSERFDVEAASAANPTLAQKQLMLRTLLARRFQLAAHWETRPRPVFALQLNRPGQLGPQLLSASCAASPPASGSACGEIDSGMRPGTPSVAWTGGRAVTLAQIAASVGGMDPFDRPIVDQTGLAGTYDFTLEWNPAADEAAPDAPQAAVIAAIREQLGLTFVTTAAPIPVLVIDKVRPPAGN